MGRMIDADALWMDIIHSMDVCDDILEIIEKQPTIEPERKEGHWIDTGSGQECSECGEIQYGYDSFRFYCQHCGADMRETRGEQDGRDS